MVKSLAFESRFLHPHLGSAIYCMIFGLVTSLGYSFLIGKPGMIDLSFPTR